MGGKGDTVTVWTVYRVNEALIPGRGAYHRVGETTDPDEYARRLAQRSTLDHLRSFVRFEAQAAGHATRELGRGLAR
jgi:hypothetical protein